MPPSPWRRLVRLWKPLRGGARPLYRPCLERLEERDCPAGPPSLTPLAITAVNSSGAAIPQPVVGTVGPSNHYSQTFDITGGSGNYTVGVEGYQTSTPTGFWVLPSGLGLGTSGASGQGPVTVTPSGGTSSFVVADMGSGPKQTGQYNVVFTATDNGPGPTNGETATAVFQFVIQQPTGSLQFSVDPASTNFSNSQVLPFGLLNNHYNATIDALPSSGNTIQSLTATLFTEGLSGTPITLASATHPVSGATVTNGGTATANVGTSQSFQINGLTPAINAQTGLPDPLTVTVSISSGGQATITIVGTPTVGTGGDGVPLFL